MQLSIFTRLATLHFVFAHTVSAALFINDANQRNTIFPVLDGRNNVPFAERSLSTYSTADVAKHNTKTDPWIIYNNNVYDVTKYINIHPDGPDDITGVAGTDATTAFNEAGHSSDANTTMATYLIGTL
ncbi:cytochrome b5, partial [Mollisia scopiformis]